MGGGVAHNIGQILMALLAVESFSAVYYVPVLMVTGLITGLLIGVLAQEMLKRLAKLELRL